ncbi:Late embryogenesis abundant (LEA) hydroxyproline-rich glycoprotein family [Striga hermonthica]|uniref:Late embryogenesis abundant (LEA) hydroxyproline-rich glycoprotein family n=1 Tax=Striga hermonthica TaxID=68872 RepID=A0A9N7RH38_STRHE|nr:Late embryogenesis abundant (LEA) hydroxyproline-rich glycoprotein family [Striga hermonthica]
MAETPDQARPLAAVRPASSDDEEAEPTTAVAAKSRRRSRLLLCSATAAGILLILAAVAAALALTVFRIRDPVIRMNGVAVQRADLIAGTAMPRPGSNMTIAADVSVKNPNFASFRYRNTTTAIYYRGVVIGEGRWPPGRARAQRTMRMNITVDVMMDRVLSQPDLASDLASGVVTMSSYTMVGGRVKVLTIGKHVTVTMNCTMTVNITSRTIMEQRCRRRVRI